MRITVISSLACSSKIVEALQLGLAMLTELGEEITSDLTQEQLDVQRVHTTDLVTRGNLADHALMGDTAKLLVMKVLARLEILAYFANPGIHSPISMKMVKMSMEYGKLMDFCFIISLLNVVE